MYGYILCPRRPTSEQTKRRSTRTTEKFLIVFFCLKTYPLPLHYYFATVRIFFCFQQIRFVRIHTPAIITSHTTLCQVNVQNNSLAGIYIIDVTLTLSQSCIKIFRIVAKCTYAEWLQPVNA